MLSSISLLVLVSVIFTFRIPILLLGLGANFGPKVIKKFVLGTTLFFPTCWLVSNVPKKIEVWGRPLALLGGDRVGS